MMKESEKKEKVNGEALMFSSSI